MICITERPVRLSDDGGVFESINPTGLDNDVEIRFVLRQSEANTSVFASLSRNEISPYGFGILCEKCKYLSHTSHIYMFYTTYQKQK